jgi:hypothetical protein
MSLEKLLKEKYNIPESESNQASRCLVNLFKIFDQVDSRQKQEELIKEKQSNIDVDYDKNNRSSKRRFDNNKN